MKMQNNLVKNFIIFMSFPETKCIEICEYYKSFMDYSKALRF